MFRFFTQKSWFIWSWIGSFIILSSLWVQVEIDVKINEWFGVFYDMIQKALAEPNAVSIEEYSLLYISFHLFPFVNFAPLDVLCNNNLFLRLLV